MASPSVSAVTTTVPGIGTQAAASIGPPCRDLRPKTGAEVPVSAPTDPQSTAVGPVATASIAEAWVLTTAVTDGESEDPKEET